MMSWKDGELQAMFRHPFDLTIASTKAYEQKKAAGVSSNGFFENWRAVLYSNTLGISGDIS